MNVDDIVRAIATSIGYLPGLHVSTTDDGRKLWISWEAAEGDGPTPQDVEELLSGPLPADRWEEVKVWQRREASRDELVRIRDAIWNGDAREAAEIVTDILVDRDRDPSSLTKCVVCGIREVDVVEGYGRCGVCLASQ